ncbi:MAG: hypothetical protein QOH16_967 [Gaiellaceae bacterium]|nr:hypothetical protein [Gaiellaceae bacterium]
MARKLSIHSRIPRVAMVVVLAILVATVAGNAHASAKNGKVAILSTSIANDVISPGPAQAFESLEAYEARSLGLAVDLIKPADWALMTTADFAAYNAVVIGDPKCSHGNLAPAVSSAGIWGAAVDGNVAVLGNAPVTTYWLNADLSSRVGSAFEVLSALRFVTADSSKTGAYVDVGCAAKSAPADSSVPLLDGIAGADAFKATGSNGACWTVGHVVDTSGALATLNDDFLSNWPCSAASALEVFTQYPADFRRYAETGNGSPYILLRGGGAAASNSIDLGPPTGSNTVGEQHTVTALVTESGAPVSGTEVFFFLTDGSPNFGQTFGDAFTDANGVATWTYDDVSGATGTDTIQASYGDSGGVVRYSNAVTQTWTAASTPDTTLPTVTLTTPAQGASFAQNAVVNASYTCADETALASCVGDVADGAPIDTATLGNYTFTVTATDGAGNVARLAHDYVVVDVTAPSITITSPVEGAVYTLNQAAAASYSCADEAGGSGLATCGGPVGSGAAISTATAGSFGFTVNATDNAGNPSSVTTHYTVLADTTAPTISIVTPTDLATYNLGQVVTASFSCADAGGSGLATCSGPVASGAALDTASAGTKSFTVSARDGAGNVSTKTVHYTVVAPPPTGNYTIKGQGKVGSTITFQIDAKSGPKRVSGEVEIEVKGHRFEGTVTTVSINGSTAMLTGTGLDNGKRVSFTLTVMDGGNKLKDTLSVSFGSYTGGGAVTEGNIRIRLSGDN